MTPIFPVLILNGRPAAGKSEIIDYLKGLPVEERIRRFRIASDSKRKFIAPQSMIRFERRLSRWIRIGMRIPAAPMRRMVLRKSIRAN